MRTLTRGLAAVTAVAAVVLASCGHPSPSSGAPLRQVGQIPLPGDGSRFDYASLDAQRGLLFLAHLGASRVIEVDVHTHQVVRTIGGLSQVHGVLVVPERRRVYATATGTNQMVALDEDTGAELGRAPTGDYPDGLAYDPLHATVWTTNESGGSETVVDANTHQVRGTVALGGEAGNVAYDSGGEMMLVDVQSRNSLAVIDPATLTIVRQVPLPGCEHDHGLAVDPVDRLAFVACDGNAVLLTVDFNTWQVTGSNMVGEDPDALAYDPVAHRLYVAAESGWVTTLDNHDRRLAVVSCEHLGDGAHIVAVDPTTGHSYYPLPTGPGGSPTLLEKATR
jgi:DNA-binding beta-propeller fold protein YncE